MYIGYEQVPVSTTVLTVSSFTVPAEATHVEVMAPSSAAGISYTMDGATAPGDQRGMIFRLTDPPKLFLVADFKRIKFVSVEGAASHLHVAYIGRQT